jgi:hypothetical protein
MAEYERTLSTMTQDSPADVQAQIDGADNALQRLLLLLTPEIRDWSWSIERWYRGRWRGAVLAATGVDLQTIIGPEGVRETVEAVIARNVALVKDVSAQIQGRISDAVFRGLTERRTAREVATDIRTAVNLYTENPALVGKMVDGKEVRLAPQASDRAGVPPYCGCRERSCVVFSFDDED